MNKTAKEAMKKYGWSMVRTLVVMGMIELVNEEEFSLLAWGVGIVTMIVLHAIAGVIEYKKDTGK